MNRQKAIQYCGNHNRIFYVFTIFPYQISFGFSIGIFEGIRIRIYLLCFKMAINITTPQPPPADSERKAT